ncbi:hypothetical protein JOD54_006191 [Actinokineospora baliensis]|uniref:hypothetical protein n=1 Tax=Actinokineospora baliensis TaxID=547056 RepID=UPI00195D1D78|nr:hypothetical protein [Actinokineospora baliensis]MBM7775987.1 hypothetical protein [Actinokineospora baliensis]
MRWGPTIGAGIAFLLVGIWVFIGVQSRTGLTPSAEPSVRRTGVAEVRSCATNPLDLWLTTVCEAQVRWEGEERTEDKRIHSVGPRVGAVDVQLRIDGSGAGRGGAGAKIVTADYPHRHDGALFFLLMMGIPGASMAIGVFLGSRLSRLLPEPAPEKFTLRPMERKRGRRKR